MFLSVLDFLAAIVSVAAVFKNPWDGQGFVEDLKPVILDLAPKLGDLLVPELIKEIGSPEKILAYGKAGVVGLNGEIEHASMPYYKNCD